MSTTNSPKGVSSPRKEPATRLDQGTAQGKPLPLRLSFYSVMKPQRVFPLTVQVRDGAAAVLANAHSLTIKPSIPGALVEPQELILDATKPKNSVTFQVTPIAKGKMPNANVKVLQQNHLVQEMPIGMKSRTQRLTWLLALATLVLPFLVTYYTKDQPIRGSIPRVAKPKDDAADASNVVYQKFGATPGVYVEYVVKRSVFDALPNIRYVVDSDPSTVIENKPSDALSWVAWTIGQAYEYLCNTPNLGPIVLAIMLGLTTVSWVFHKSRRRNLNRTVKLPSELRPTLAHA
jgi:hypothetical protein